MSLALPTPRLAYADVEVGRLYLPEEVAGLLGFRSVETLSRRWWIVRLGPVKIGGKRRYPGERLIAYFESIGWAKPAARKPETAAQRKRRAAASTARALAAR